MFLFSFAAVACGRAGTSQVATGYFFFVPSTSNGEINLFSHFTMQVIVKNGSRMGASEWAPKWASPSALPLGWPSSRSNGVIITEY